MDSISIYSLTKRPLKQLNKEFTLLRKLCNISDMSQDTIITNIVLNFAFMEQIKKNKNDETQKRQS